MNKNLQKTISLIITCALLTVFNPANAEAEIAYPLNTQNAEITNDGYWNLTFEYFKDEVGSSRSHSFTLPNIEIRHGFADKFRLGILSSLILGIDEGESSSFGFDNLRATAEYQFLHGTLFGHDFLDHVTAYINQDFPTIHNDLLGSDSHGFESGVLIEHTIDKFTFYSELGYRFDVPDNDAIFHSVVYNNAVAWYLHDRFQPFIELIGQTSYGDGHATSLQIVPGWAHHIVNDYYVYFGFPAGLNQDSSDFGVQMILSGTVDLF